MKRILVASLAFAATLALSCSAVPESPPDPTDRLQAALLEGHRLVLQDVFHGERAEKIEIGRSVYDPKLHAPVVIAYAEDGRLRWLPAAEWIPIYGADPKPAATHSEVLGAWLDAGCKQAFVVTPSPYRHPRWVWQPAGQGQRVWRIGDKHGYAELLLGKPLWSGHNPSTCTKMAPLEYALMQTMGLWTLGEMVPPEELVEGVFSSQAHDPVVSKPACESCDQTNVKTCGGIPSLCDCSKGTPPNKGCCCSGGSSRKKRSTGSGPDLVAALGGGAFSLVSRGGR